MQISGVMELDKALLATGFPYDQREEADFCLSFFKAFMTRSQASDATVRRLWISAMWLAVESTDLGDETSPVGHGGRRPDR